MVTWKNPDLEEERCEVTRTAHEEGLLREDLDRAMESASLVTLTEDVWSRIDNTDSYNTLTLEDARKMADGYDRDWRSIKKAYDEKGTLPAPIILMKADGSLYCVGGNTRLMIARVYRDTPLVLWAELDR